MFGLSYNIGLILKQPAASSQQQEELVSILFIKLYWFFGDS